MIIDFNYKSPQGDVLDIANNNDFILTNVDGLTVNDNSISAANVAFQDGDTITNVRANPRAIVCYCEFNQGVNVETAKRKIMNVIKPKQTGVLTYTHNKRVLTINATVEKIAMPRFNNKVVMQITFYCSYPFWQDAAFIVSDIKRVIALHHFELIITGNNPLIFGKIGGQTTRTIENNGDVAVGVNIVIVAFGTYTNPRIERTIDGAFFKINATMSAGDVIEINTTRGNKYVRLNGQNIINDVVTGSTWLQLDVGDNELTLSDDNNSGNAYMQIKHKRSFV